MGFSIAIWVMEDHTPEDYISLVTHPTEQLRNPFGIMGILVQASVSLQNNSFGEEPCNEVIMFKLRWTA